MVEEGGCHCLTLSPSLGMLVMASRYTPTGRMEGVTELCLGDWLTTAVSL